MARKAKLVLDESISVSLRLAEPELGHLLSLLFRRYPHYEWACFARFGWRISRGLMVLTLASVDEPQPGDLDEEVGNVAISDPYPLRTALAAEHHPLAVGVVHSHPQGYPPQPSAIDDEMDSYFSRYFLDFAPNRPFASLIFSELRGRLSVSGRVFWNGKWHGVSRLVAEGAAADCWTQGRARPSRTVPSARLTRLTSAFGAEAAARLRDASVAVIGAGGTGSAAIEVLVRAGVGKLIIIDPDHLEESNVERVHGSTTSHLRTTVSKAALAREHALSIDPTCEVSAIIGRLPQSMVVDALLEADVVLGCTDRQHSRLALSDLATRYLLVSLDCGVALEGEHGTVTAQIIQLTRFLPADPCALCRGMTVAARLFEELMSPTEIATRRAAAAAAVARGEDPDPYWRDTPQLNTVGYLTTTAGAMTAGYAIGWITGRFSPPFSRLQMNLVAPHLDVTDQPQAPIAGCPCRRMRGWADQGNIDALISPPDHWPIPRQVTS